MIEVDMSFELLPGKDQEAYFEIAKAVVSMALEAKAKGALVVEINLERTPQSDLMDHTLLGKAGEMVSKLVEGWS